MFKNNDADRLFMNPRPKFKERPVQKRKQADVAGIVEENHGRYQIKAGMLGGAFVARAFPKAAAKAQGLIAEAKGDSEQAAIEALKAIIEARDVQRSEDRRLDERSSISVPTEMEFLEALRQASLSQAQVAMLKSLSIAAEDGLTFSQLASAAGYKSGEAAAKVFKKAGVLIADYLGIEIADSDASNNQQMGQILAFRNVLEEEAPDVWIMHQELRAAVRAAL